MATGTHQSVQSQLCRIAAGASGSNVSSSYDFRTHLFRILFHDHVSSFEHIACSEAALNL